MMMWLRLWLLVVGGGGSLLRSEANTRRPGGRRWVGSCTWCQPPSQPHEQPCKPGQQRAGGRGSTQLRDSASWTVKTLISNRSSELATPRLGQARVQDKGDQWVDKWQEARCGGRARVTRWRDLWTERVLSSLQQLTSYSWAGCRKSEPLWSELERSLEYLGLPSLSSGRHRDLGQVERLPSSLSTSGADHRPLAILWKTFQKQAKAKVTQLDNQKHFI